MKTRSPISPPTDPTEHARWLDGIVRLAEGARLRGVHPDTLRREALGFGSRLARRLREQ